MTPVETIIAYLDGRTPLPDFIAQVMDDSALQEFLEQDAMLPRYIDQGNLFLYLMDKDVADAGSDINVREALSALLKALGIAHKVDGAAAADYGLVLDALPAWVSPPGSYLATILAGLPALNSKQQRRAFVRARIAEDFRFLKRPPKWLQAPDWPLEGNVPMLFVGQLDANAIAHDDAQIYVFFNARDGSIHTRMQRA